MCFEVDFKDFEGAWIKVGALHEDDMSDSLVSDMRLVLKKVLLALTNIYVFHYLHHLSMRFDSLFYFLQLYFCIFFLGEWIFFSFLPFLCLLMGLCL